MTVYGFFFMSQVGILLLLVAPDREFSVHLSKMDTLPTLSLTDIFVVLFVYFSAKYIQSVDSFQLIIIINWNIF